MRFGRDANYPTGGPRISPLSPNSPFVTIEPGGTLLQRGLRAVRRAWSNGQPSPQAEPNTASGAGVGRNQLTNSTIHPVAREGYGECHGHKRPAPELH